MVDVLVRAICMYLGFYLAIFLGGPVLAMVDEWTGLSLWSWWLLAIGVSFAGDLIAVWPEDRLEPVALTGASSAAWRPGTPSIGGRVRVGMRPKRVAFGPSTGGALHRRVRFGHTRLR